METKNYTIYYDCPDSNYSYAHIQLNEQEYNGVMKAILAIANGHTWYSKPENESVIKLYVGNSMDDENLMVWGSDY